MTFQRKTARRIIALVRSLHPAATIIVGGYDPSLAPDVYEDPSFGVDIIVRGEGDLTMRELLRALEIGADLATVHGMSFRHGRDVRSQRRSPRQRSRRRGPAAERAARVLGGYTFLGRQIDVVETSRGCTYDCSFCSIIEMRGRNFHVWPIERVIDDIRDAHARGARAIFMVDDNITLNVAAVQGAVRGHHRGRTDRHSLHRSGHDVGDCVGRRRAGSADAARRLPLRVPGHRERRSTRTWRFCSAAAKNADREGRTHRRQRDDCARSTCCIATACASSAG